MINALYIENLNKKYPTFSLKNVSFSIRPGDIMGFIGRNGAGKTTTLKCIMIRMASTQNCRQGPSAQGEDIWVMTVWSELHHVVTQGFSVLMSSITATDRRWSSVMRSLIR